MLSRRLFLANGTMSMGGKDVGAFSLADEVLIGISVWSGHLNSYSLV